MPGHIKIKHPLPAGDTMMLPPSFFVAGTATGVNADNTFVGTLSNGGPAKQPAKFLRINTNLFRWFIPFVNPFQVNTNCTLTVQGIDINTGGPVTKTRPIVVKGSRRPLPNVSYPYISPQNISDEVDSFAAYGQDPQVGGVFPNVVMCSIWNAGLGITYSANYIYNDGNGFWYAEFPPMVDDGNTYTLTVIDDQNDFNPQNSVIL